MDPIFVTAVVAVVTAVVASSATYKLAGPNAAKIEAEETEIITRTALALIAPLEKQLDAVTKRVGDLEQENRALRNWSRMLSAQVIEGGATPVPYPAN